MKIKMLDFRKTYLLPFKYEIPNYTQDFLEKNNLIKRYLKFFKRFIFILLSGQSSLEVNDISSLYGIEYNGGFIFNVNNEDGSMIVATDYSQIGSVAWGDVFSLDTSAEIGSGDSNTQMIVDGNQNDNSADGFEFGSDDYAFKIVSDLEYNDNNDWFIPSRDSMKAIFDNVHSLGFGNFNESLIYWSSTKVGYSPYVMGFNFDSWGGEAFLGSCASPNGILIARKIN